MKIAAIQLCSSNSLVENLSMTTKSLQEAARNHAGLVVLPEMFAMIGETTVVKEPFGHGRVQDFLKEQACRLKLWIVAGTIPILSLKTNKIKAACLLYNDKGQVVARYDKMHLFDVTLSETEAYQESDTTEPGEEVVVVDTPFGRLGLAVCYDLRFPELFRAMVNQGAEFFAIPAAFTVKTGLAHWELLMRARAVENLSYMIGACQGGLHASGRETYGHSMIVNPWGEIVVVKANNQPGIIYHSLDLEKQKNWRKCLPALLHQRLKP